MQKKKIMKPLKLGDTTGNYADDFLSVHPRIRGVNVEIRDFRYTRQRPLAELDRRQTRRLRDYLTKFLRTK